MPPGVFLSHGQRVGAQISSGYAGVGAVVFQRYGNGPAAGAQVKGCGRGKGFQMLDADFAQAFGLLPGDQHPAVHQIGQAVEPLLSQQILQGLPLSPMEQQRPIVGAVIRGKFLCTIQTDGQRIFMENVGQHQQRVLRGIGYLRVGQLPGGLGQGLMDGHVTGHRKRLRPAGRPALP